MSARDIVTRLAGESGIEIDGPQPWDIAVHNDAFFDAVLRRGSLGLGESYMAGHWDCDDLESTLARLAGSSAERRILRDPRLAISLFAFYLKQVIPNRGSRSRAFEVGRQHYDIGNELYRRMLDRRMIYSCGYWRDAQTLDEAQEAKLDLICRKLELKEGMRILDIGCGWGGFLRFAAERYGVSGIGITVSGQQAEYAAESTREFPVEIRQCDYRDLNSSVNGRFDRILSIGMFEHVGYKNFPVYMRVVHDLLEQDGVTLIHTIGCNEPIRSRDRWIARYIFPNSKLPAIAQIEPAARPFFLLEDLHNFGPDYTTTLRAWLSNFNAAWPQLREHYDERFRRMWTYFLCASAAVFRTRKTQLWQLVFSKYRTAMYRSVR